MGYELHITRAKDWLENKELWISSEEWLSLVEEDKELTLDTTNGPFFTNWSGQSRHKCPWFDWSEGNIYTKNPDKEIFRKMLNLADRLNARVQGDDGEMYNDINDFPNQDVPEITIATNKPLYFQRDRLWSIISILIIILVITTVNVLDIW